MIGTVAIYFSECFQYKYNFRQDPDQSGHASEVSVSVREIADSSRETVDSITHSDEASGEIASTLSALQTKASQFRV